MYPAYKPRDHVLTFNWAQAKVGDVIVFKTDSGQVFRHRAQDRGARMTAKEEYFIKRVYKLVDNYVYVSGDNSNESSRIGPIEKSQIIGKVVLKY